MPPFYAVLAAIMVAVMTELNIAFAEGFGSVLYIIKRLSLHIIHFQPWDLL